MSRTKAANFHKYPTSRLARLIRACAKRNKKEVEALCDGYVPGNPPIFFFDRGCGNFSSVLDVYRFLIKLWIVRYQTGAGIVHQPKIPVLILFLHVGKYQKVSIVFVLDQRNCTCLRVTALWLYKKILTFGE